MERKRNPGMARRMPRVALRSTQATDLRLKGFALKFASYGI